MPASEKQSLLAPTVNESVDQTRKDKTIAKEIKINDKIYKTVTPG